MKRLLAAALVVTLLTTPTASAQQGGLDDFGIWLSVLTSNATRDAGTVVAVTESGRSFKLAENHAPVADARWVFNYSELPNPPSDPVGDAGDGTDASLDLVSGFGARLHLTPDAEALINAAPPDAGSVVGGFGFARPLDGTAPSLPAESAVFFFQSAGPITADNPQEFLVGPSFQVSVTGFRAEFPPTESADANGGNNFSIDMYQSSGQFGTGSYDFPGGIFTERQTAWSGGLQGDRGLLFGPAGELEGVDEIEINLVSFPDFDALPIGSSDSFPVIEISTFAEGDANGNGVWDLFEVDEEPEQPPPPPEAEDEAAQDPVPVEDDAAPPAVVEEVDEPGPAPGTDTSTGSDDGGGALIVILVGLFLFGVGAGLWFWYKRREQESCVPEQKALSAAKAQVATAKTAVANAKEKVARAEAGVATAAGAREQAALRQQEAAIAQRDANSELALAEGRLSDAQDRQTAAQRAYDICTGLVAPDPAPEPEVSPPSGPPPVEVPAGGPPGVVVDPPGTSTAPPEPGPSTAPPPDKTETCTDGEERLLEELGKLQGRFVLAYTITAGTAGIRSTEQEVAEVVRSLDGIADAISGATDGVQAGGSGVGAVVAQAAGTVLELTARLGAGTAALTNELLEGHRVHTFTYEEIAVTVDLTWVKLERCVGDEWQCFYDLKVQTWRQSNITTSEKEFEGRPDLRDRAVRQYQRKGEAAVSAGNEFDLFMDGAYVGPC